jgi:hypothetical protein
MPTDPRRRDFLALLPAVLAAPTLVGCASRPRSDAAAPALAPGKTAAPRIALIGCSGRGAENLGDLLGAGASVVALCDVDANAREAASRRVASAAVYTDFRELFRDRRKLKLDGVEFDELVLKDNLRNLVRGRFKAMRGQVGYKLPVLLESRARAPVDPSVSIAGRVPESVGYVATGSSLEPCTVIVKLLDAPPPRPSDTE